MFKWSSFINSQIEEHCYFQKYFLQGLCICNCTQSSRGNMKDNIKGSGALTSSWRPCRPGSHDLGTQAMWPPCLIWGHMAWYIGLIWLKYIGIVACFPAISIWNVRKFDNLKCLKCWNCCLFSSNKHTSVPQPHWCFSKSAISAKIQMPFSTGHLSGFSAHYAEKCIEVKFRIRYEFCLVQHWHTVQCTTFSQHLYNICTTFAQHLHSICTAFAQPLSESRCLVCVPMWTPSRSLICIQ